MHRSSFGRNKAVAYKPPEPRQELVAPQAMPDYRQDRASVRYVMNAVERLSGAVEDGMMAQIACLERMEPAIAGLQRVVQTISERLAVNTDNTGKQVNDLRNAIAGLGAALKGHVDEMAGKLHGATGGLASALDSQRNSLKAELAKLSDIVGSQKGHGEAIARLSLDSSAAKRGAEQGIASVMQMLGDLDKRLDDLAKVKPTKTKSSKADQSILDEIRAYMNAEKKVIRDPGGDIVGWKVASGYKH